MPIITLTNYKIIIILKRIIKTIIIITLIITTTIINTTYINRKWKSPLLYGFKIP